MSDTAATPDEVVPESEATRLGGLYSWQSLVFIALCATGLLFGLAYVFGWSWGDRRLYEGEYYWVFIGVFTAAAFIALPATRGQRNVPIYDVAAVLALSVSVYFAAHAWDIVQSGWTNMPFGVVIWLLMLELARRSGGFPFLLVVVVLGLYPLFADYLPGLLMGIPYDFDRMIEAHVFRAEGMMGITTKIVAEIVLGFLVFAGVLIATGAGTFFIDLANAGFGRYRGGPAKVAVVASAFFGSLSGSIFSNIAGTGSLTIPTMKKVGYPPHYAGAIEACASTGGVVMPPVMGAIAFVMAITIGVDYATVMVAAIVPSLLFYFGLLLQVDAYAARMNLHGMPADKLPSARRVLKRGWPFILVLVFLVWGLLYKRWEYYAPWYACVLMVSLGGGNICLVILFGVVACFIMGMAGLAIVAYIFLAVTLAPAIIELGQLNVIAVHFFIIYYAMLSAITPPVGAAAFLAATIAGARPMKTSFTAMRLGIVIYFVPLFFLFQPALVLQGDLTPLLWVLPSIIIGIMLISGGLEAYLLGVGKVAGWLRLPLGLAGFAFSFPGLLTTAIGGISSAILVALVWRDNRRAAAGAPNLGVNS